MEWMASLRLPDGTIETYRRYGDSAHFVGMNGSRSKVRRLLADPAVTTVVVEHRDRLGRMNTELVARNRALKAVGCAQRDIGPQAVIAAESVTPHREND